MAGEGQARCLAFFLFGTGGRASSGVFGWIAFADLPDRARRGHPLLGLPPTRVRRDIAKEGECARISDLAERHDRVHPMGKVGIPPKSLDQQRDDRFAATDERRGDLLLEERVFVEAAPGSNCPSCRAMHSRGHRNWRASKATEPLRSSLRECGEPQADPPGPARARPQRPATRIGSSARSRRNRSIARLNRSGPSTAGTWPPPAYRSRRESGSR